ncbi:MAG TPA: serine protease [Terriglobales bacterium]|nr:serine protease [Terriglobales bacterium]
MIGRFSLILVCLVQLGLAPATAPAEVRPRTADTDEIYERFAPAVVQIRILNRASSSKKAIGSGFYAATTGRIITNYHVVSDLVQHPKKYQAELVGKDGVTIPVALVHLDVVHDLALLEAPVAPAALLALAAEPPRQGTRLFSLGNPFDLGTSIVEGTYNGLLQETLYEKIHFTGSINPGMSGGPAVDSRGQVVGINVATAGNALSFLIPAKYAAALIAAANDPAYQTPANFTGIIRDQLIQNQQVLMDHLLGGRFEELSLGSFRVPGRFAPFVKCWGDEQTEARQPYDAVVHSCSTSDSVYVADTLSSGAIKYSHQWYRAKDLNRFQFYSLYEDQFTAGGIGTGSRDLVTRFECNTEVVGRDGVDMKMVLCLRGYKKMRGLYDAFLMAASLNDNFTGLQTKLELHGVTFENAHLLARKFVDAITWAPPSS